MNTPEYSVDYFINFFSGVPDKEWCVIHLSVTRAIGVQHCALGHLGEDYDAPTPQSVALQKLFRFYLGVDVETVNDVDPRWPITEDLHPFAKNTPKARILAALHDIKAKQEAEKPKVAPVVAPAPCTHMWLAGNCLYCGTAQPAPMPTPENPLAPLFHEIARLK